MFDINKFNVIAFNERFSADIEKLKGAERITKDMLRDMSRYVLEQLHTCEDIRNVNALIRVLTPMNRKVAILYFKAFGGFKWSDEHNEFTVKAKARYDVARKTAQEFLDDPLNNIWTWAERNVQVEQKPLDLKHLTKTVENYLAKAEKEGVNKNEVFKAIIAGGLDMESLLDIMKEVAEQE